jgi:hypothetical protein
VQLGRVEVEPAVLAGAGAGLDALLTGREIDDRPDEWPEGLPHDGWRVIHAQPARGPIGPREVLAAPSPGHSGGYSLIYLAEGDGRWRFGWDEGPLPVSPGMAARREGLELAWRDDVLRTRLGQSWKLTIGLANRSWRSWHNVAADADDVTGWLLDEDGNRLASGGLLGHTSFSEPLPCLRPHEVIRLPVTILAPDIEALGAGRYSVQATLTDLGLCSDQATLILSE